MIKPPVYPRKRGATAYFDIEAFTGTPTGSETVRAVLKVARLNEFAPGDSAAIAAEFSVLYVAAVGAVKAYWRLTLSAAQTEVLAADIYITDVRIEQGGVVIVTDPILVDFRERVTPPLA